MFPCPAGCVLRQQQQQEQQEGSMSHCTNSGIKIENYKNLSKTIVFLGFQKGR